MTWRGWMFVVLPALAFGCAGAPKSASTVVIPAQAPPPASTSDVAIANAGAPSEPIADTPHVPPPGSDGPADAVGMIGDAGKIFPADATTVMLVNTAAMRVHPMGPRAMQLLTTVLVGWDQFMPID